MFADSRLSYGFTSIATQEKAILMSKSTCSFILLIAVSLSATALCSASSGRGDWWMFQHDPQHTGRSSFVGPSGTPKIEWTFKIVDAYKLNNLSLGVVGADGTIYVGSHGNSLYAVNPDGTKKWEFNAKGESLSPAIAIDGTIYIGAIPALYAINPDGIEKWEFDAGEWNFGYPPAIATDGTIYIPSLDGKLYAINPDGTKKWAFHTTESDRDLYSSPAIGYDGTIYTGTADYLYAINPNGKKIWGFNVQNGIGSSPAIGPDGTIYVGSGMGKLYAIKPNGVLKWAFLPFLGESSPAIAHDGTIYIGSRDNKFYAINPDGSKKWSLSTNGEVGSPSIDANGIIYFASRDGLTAVNPDGTKKWTCSEVGSSLTGKDGTLEVGTPVIGRDGTIYAIYEDNLSAIRSMSRQEIAYERRINSYILMVVIIIFVMVSIALLRNRSGRR